MQCHHVGPVVARRYPIEKKENFLQYLILRAQSVECEGVPKTQILYWQSPPENH